MQRTNFEPRPDLMEAAYALAVEIRERKWDHVESLKSKPATACDEIVEELRRRCPGHTASAYQRAIADGLFGSR